MSEYIEITTEESDEIDSLYILTNLRLTDGDVEDYGTVAAMEFGSPLAQALSAVGGLESVTIEANEIFVRRQSDADWHGIIDDMTAVLKDFFL